MKDGAKGSASPKPPTMTPEQHKKNSYDTLGSTQHKDGNNKQGIWENKESNSILEDTGPS